MSTTMIIAIAVGCGLVAMITIGLILAKLYTRASKQTSFVRTGLGGEKVIMNGGALVLPVLHEVMPVNMKTIRLEVRRANEQALITRDRMRVDVQGEFYVRAQPTTESIAAAAQTLGMRTMDPESLKELVEGKFVDALRAVAAEMAMEELHEQRVEFVQKVQSAVSEDLLKNGLELETVSLTALDQTDQSHFNPQNAFDAQGLTKLTQEIQARMKQRNDIEQDTEVEIQKKNLHAERQKLELAKETEYARLEQEREIQVRKAEQEANIAKEQAAKEQEAKDAQIAAKQKIDQAQIISERAVEEERIQKDLLLKEKEISKERSVETAEIERQKSVTLADQEKAIAIAEKSKDKSVTQSEADKARALAVTAEEQVITAREKEIAERSKAIELVEARKQAEKEALGTTIAANAEKNAAVDSAEAARTLASGEAEAEVIRAEAAHKRYQVEAEGKKALHEAENVLDPDVIAMRIKMAIVANLDKIIRESVKPMEAIEGIKIYQVDGLNPGGNSGRAGENSTSGNLADQLVNSALRYRSQAPLVDNLLDELGLTGGDINGLTAGLRSQTTVPSETAPPEPGESGGGQEDAAP